MEGLATTIFAFATVFAMLICGVAVGRVLVGASCGSASLAIAAPAGIASFFVVGGVLWASGLYTPLAFVTCVLAISGVAGLIVSARTIRPPAHSVAFDWPQMALWCALAVCLTALPPEINGSDDPPAYLAFLREVAQIGAPVEQPFSERRLFTFGGHLTLAAPMREWLGLRALSGFEPGLAVLLIGWMACAARMPQKHRRVTGLLLSLFFVLSLHVLAKPIVNTNPVLLAAALCCAATWALWPVLNGERLSVHRACIVGLLAAISLTMRPFPIVYFGALAIWLLPAVVRSPRGVTAGVAAFLLALAPFMIAMQMASDTPFYPFLGPGNETDETPAARFNSAVGIGRSLPVTVLPLLLGLILRFWAENKSRRAYDAILSSAVISTAVVTFLLPSHELPRFTFAVNAGALVALILADENRPLPKTLLWFGRWTIPAFGGLVGSVAIIYAVGAVSPTGPLARIHDRFVQPFLAEDARNSACAPIESRFADGEGVLVVAHACAEQFDYVRNRILLHDNPGDAAGAAGCRSPIDWTAYFAANGIHWVLFRDDRLIARLEHAVRVRCNGEGRLEAFLTSQAVADRISDGLLYRVAPLTSGGTR